MPRIMAKGKVKEKERAKEGTNTPYIVVKRGRSLRNVLRNGESPSKMAPGDSSIGREKRTTNWKAGNGICGSKKNAKSLRKTSSTK